MDISLIKYRFLLSIFLILFMFCNNKAETIQITGIYSDIQFFEESGDVAGIELMIVSTNDGYYVIFQSAEGDFRIPVVVKLLVKGDQIEFTLPENSGYSGKFKGKITSNELTGSFEKGYTDFRGNKEIVLKRGKSFWQ